jgi:hypothetical protein
MDAWMGTPVKGASVFTLLKFAVLPIAKVLVMCALGLLLASRSVNILPATSRKQLSKVRYREPPKSGLPIFGFHFWHILGLECFPAVFLMLPL